MQTRARRANPAVSAEQYHLAQAVLSGRARTGHMPVEVAREIVDKTPKKLRSEFSRNPGYGRHLDENYEMRPLHKLFESKSAAEKYKRLLEAEGKPTRVEKVGKQWGVIRTDMNPQRKRRGKRNPEDDAAGMYESFHGEPSTGVVEFTEEEHYHGNLAELGVLVGLKVRTVAGDDVTIGFDAGDPKDAASNPWPWNSFTKTTIYHVPTGKEYGVVADHKGYRIFKQAGAGGGPSEFVVPGLDKESKFDTLPLAKKFVDYWTKKRVNSTGPIGQASRLVGKGLAYVTQKGPVGDLYKTGTKVGGYLDSKLGRVLNPDDSYNGDADAVLLCANESGNQLYIVGGDQTLDLKSLKIDERDSVLVGEIWCLCYRTAKNFGSDDRDAGQEMDYVHGLGPEKAHARLRRGADLWEDAQPPKDSVFGTGQLPSLVYDSLNQKMSMAGGIYKIERPLIGTSPGIEN